MANDNIFGILSMYALQLGTMFYNSYSCKTVIKIWLKN